MQLSDRKFMTETRYSQSFGDLANRKNKLLSTGFSKNSMNATTTLPKLSRSLSSNSTKSAKQRMSGINEQLDELKRKMNQLKMDTRESRRYVNFLKDDLAERLLNESKNQLTLQVKKMQSAFKFIRKDHADRTQVIRRDCQELAVGSKSLVEQIENLKIRLDNLEETMGVYTGKEKHKY